MRHLACLLLGLGCAQRLQRQVVPPTQTARLDHQSPVLKAHMRDGRVYVLSAWRVDEAAQLVNGSGQVQGVDRRVHNTGEFAVPLADVALFETNVVETSPGVAALAVVTLVTGGAGIYCAIHPKACFGSCPTFYVDGVLEAEGFSDAVAPSLEATDLDALWRVRAAGRELLVRMTNEAMETHVVKSVRVLAARRPPGGRVVATQDGELREARVLEAPTRCAGPKDEGGGDGDCLAAVRALDGRERSSTTDENDLAAREVLEIEFPPVSAGAGAGAGAGAERMGVVIGARQTLVTTFLFYQLLAYLGRQAGDALAALERGGPALRERVFGMGRVIGGIEVMVEDGAGRWQVAGRVQETGPLAADVKVVPLPPGCEGRRVRLRLARGHWRLDLVARARLGKPVTAEPLALASGPALPVVAQPGDAHRFVFTLPERPAEWELFLESRGYYLEWMRAEWLAEEDPARAALMLGAPEIALRQLAPAFKRAEPLMESLFWKSRYARPAR